MRLIRPVPVARLCALLLGISICLPGTTEATQKTTRRKSSSTASTNVFHQGAPTLMWKYPSAQMLNMGGAESPDTDARRTIFSPV